MANELLIHTTGLCALALNVLALIRTCETSLRVQSGIAGIIWALNNLLLGAHTAAALSLLSAGRTATSVATLHIGTGLRLALFVGFVVLTLGISAATWQGWSSVFMTMASVLSTYAMFYMRGRSLRWSMVVVSALWMHNAWSYDSWEQMAANAVTAAAGLYGAWRIGRQLTVERSQATEASGQPPRGGFRSARAAKPRLAMYLAGQRPLATNKRVAGRGDSVLRAPPLRMCRLTRSACARLPVSPTPPSRGAASGATTA